MVTLAVLPGMLRTSLVVANLASPGNSSRAINLLVSQPGIVGLGYLPRVTIKHTAYHTEGQIYIPEVNGMLAVGCILLVLTFRESVKLAAAYGIAVTGTMAITSVLYYIVIRHTWGWNKWKSMALLALFLTFDIPFLVAN